MDREQLEEFRALLLAERKSIIDKAQGTAKELSVSSDDLPDENDMASAVYDRGFELQLRGREGRLLKKLEQAMDRLEDGEFGICESCGDDISMKRLRARPVTTLCIACKEEQERLEKLYKS